MVWWYWVIWEVCGRERSWHNRIYHPNIYCGGTEETHKQVFIRGSRPWSLVPDACDYEVGVWLPLDRGVHNWSVRCGFNWAGTLFITGVLLPTRQNKMWSFFSPFHVMKEYRGADLQFCVLTSTLDGCVWLTSSSCHFTPMSVCA